MTTRRRRDYMEALGLAEWRIRADGPLATQVLLDATHEPAPVTATAATTAATPAPTRSPVPVVAESDMSFPEAVTPQSGGYAGALAGMDWEALERHLETRDHRGAQRPVFGVGARDADVLIVGEAPGAQEDKHGVPFVGRAGKLLDRMLFAIGCSRDTNVYITNICKFRPPNNRDPRPDEVAADWPVLERQIELMDPKLVVAVGRVAAQTLLDSSENLSRMRGRLHKYPRRDLDVLVTYHPAFLLRSPQMKARAWDDLKAIAAHIGQAGRAA